jgi:hypothetical protein
METNDAHQPPARPADTSAQSAWEKAKEKLGELSSHASKAAAIGASGVAKTAEIGKQTLEAGKQAYSGSKLESAVNYIDNELDHRGAKTAIKDTTGAVVDKLDQVTGKRLIELLEEKLRSQDAYNDVLATRLAEALERITKLEARFNED